MSVTYSFINIPVLQLYKSSADCGDVTLLVGESHSTSTLIKHNWYYAQYRHNTSNFVTCIITGNLFLHQEIAFFKILRG